MKKIKRHGPKVAAAAMALAGTAAAAYLGTRGSNQVTNMPRQRPPRKGTFKVSSLI